MKRCLNIVLMFVSIFLFSACASLPKPGVVKSANYGEKPSVDFMVSAAQKHMSKFLIDPYSAVYSFSPPVKSWAIGGSGSEGNVQMGKTYFGYSSVCTINAKNRFGGYTGNQEYLFMIYEKNGNKYYFAHFDGYQALEVVTE
jgi:hypothetical protein